MTKKILWVDDDPRRRFIYEETLIREKYNFDLEWADDINKAGELLKSKKFDAIIIDQMLPVYNLQDTPDAWGGCALLYWLRGQKKRPCHGSRVDNKAWGILNQIGKPLKKNMNIKAIILSAFHDDDIFEKTEQASDMDKDILLLSKPINEEEFKKFLNEIKGIKNGTDE